LLRCSNGQALSYSPRKRYAFRNGEFVEVSTSAEAPVRTQIIQDTMGDTWNPVDGKTYDSKSRYYSSIKSSGSHIIEKGEKPAARAEDTSLKSDLIATDNQLWGR
jgi:hypothetical protein